MTIPITSVYLDDDGHRTGIFVRPIPEVDTLGNVYLEIVDDSDREGLTVTIRRVWIPLHLADEFETAWREARQALEEAIPAEDEAEEGKPDE